jgi:hypothetical protein
MTNEEITAGFRYLQAEIELLRARNDVLSIALKRVIVNSHDPRAVYGAVMKSLDVSSALALYSTEPTETYLEGFDIAAQVVAGWRAALPPVDGS